MPKPQLRAVDKEINHPRDLARQRVKRWRSDAEKLKLSTTNIHDDEGAKVLNVTDILSHEHHSARIGRK